MKIILKILFVILLPMALRAQTVYVTPSGNKYHKANCRMVENVSKSMALADAVNSGYSACKICKPSLAYGSSSSKSVSGKSTVTYQCRGTTKKGTRCKHKTHIANGYCFQHGG
jgi:methylphosphotriester-DNA--protein-cysteine methyltransferase